MCLLLSGDIHQCPGPTVTGSSRRQPKRPCTACDRGVRSNSKALTCDTCAQWTHIRCSGFPVDQYDQLVATDAAINCVCPRCCLATLPEVGADDSLAGDRSTDTDGDQPPSDSTGPSDAPREDTPQDEYSRCFKTRGLHSMHLNVRSLLPKIDEVRRIAQTTSIPVMCFTETWLDATITDPEIEIENYLVVRRDRNRNGGGVCMYIRSDVAFDPRLDLARDDLEAIWVNILLPKSRPILMGTCYRPPDKSNFYDALEDMFSNANILIGMEIIVHGDFNTNVSKSANNNLVKSLNNFCSMFDMYQLIDKPTRVSASTESIIDLVLVSDKCKITQSGVIICGLSDHMITYCTRKVSKPSSNVNNTVTLRSLKEYTKELFVEQLSKVNWFPVIDCDDVDVAWSNFKTMFTCVLDSIAPVKTIRVKQRTESWFDDDIYNGIRSRDKALRDFKVSKEESKYSLYKKLRNDVQRRIDKAKENYFKETLNENKDNPKKLWETVKQLGTGKACKTKSCNIGLKLNSYLKNGIIRVKKNSEN